MQIKDPTSMSPIFLLLILSSCSFLLLSAADDGTVLLKIREQLGNPDILSSWVEGFDFCNGAGDVIDQNTGIGFSVHITCTNSGRVDAIVLSDVIANNASFPQAICDLTELEAFSMKKISGMYGPFPSCINNLVHLESFSVHNMQDFYTPIPEFLNSKNLTRIDFCKSGAIGGRPIPLSLSTSFLPKLQVLDLSWNGIIGIIPWELAQNPPGSLYLDGNNMSGELPRCAAWKNLETIDLSHNSFSGDASSLFGKEKTVVDIDLSFNQFEFDISNIEAPENLTYLDLSNNLIYGKVPQLLANKLWPIYFNVTSNIPCKDNSAGTYEPHACLCGDPPMELPPCPVSPPPPTTVPCFTTFNLFVYFRFFLSSTIGQLMSSNFN